MAHLGYTALRRGPARGGENLGKAIAFSQIATPSHADAADAHAHVGRGAGGTAAVSQGHQTIFRSARDAASSAPARGAGTYIPREAMSW